MPAACPSGEARITPGDVTSCDCRHRGARCRDPDSRAARRWPRCSVTGRRPGTSPPRQTSSAWTRSGKTTKTPSGRESSSARYERGPPSGPPVPLELAVDRADEGVRAEASIAVRGEPGRLEAAKVRPAAFPARAMAGRQRRRLVQEEQLGVAVRSHHLTAPAAKRQHAGDPGAVAAGDPPHDPPAGIVEAAAVAHERAARGRGDQVAERRHAVLEGAAHVPLSGARPRRRCRGRSAGGRLSVTGQRRLATAAPSSASS